MRFTQGSYEVLHKGYMRFYTRVISGSSTMLVFLLQMMNVTEDGSMTITVTHFTVTLD